MSEALKDYFANINFTKQNGSFDPRDMEYLDEMVKYAIDNQDNEKSIKLIKEAVLYIENMLTKEELCFKWYEYQHPDKRYIDNKPPLIEIIRYNDNSDYHFFEYLDCQLFIYKNVFIGGMVINKILFPSKTLEKLWGNNDKKHRFIVHINRKIYEIKEKYYNLPLKYIMPGYVCDLKKN